MIPWYGNTGPLRIKIVLFFPGLSLTMNDHLEPGSPRTYHRAVGSLLSRKYDEFPVWSPTGKRGGTETVKKTHLDQFLKLSADDHKWIGRKPLDWWIQVFGDRRTRLRPGPVSRHQLKVLCKNPEYSNKEVLAAVMAWGGMRRNHGRAQIQNLKATCKIVSELRTGQLTKYEAYGRFFERRRNGQLPCMGPAYYTKLIFFCTPRHDGYIMDQWTSKSINLIYGTRIVDLNNKGLVTDRNDVGTYEPFCRAVERLARYGKWSPEETEIRLFSYGGAKKGAWRDYVIRFFGQ